MGYLATWRVQCISVTEASEIVTACKRLQRENWRRARWELQNRFSALRLNSTLSAAARPFQPQTASGSTLVADLPQGPAFPNGPIREGPAATGAVGTPVERGPPIPHYTLDDEGASTDASAPEMSFCRRRSGRGNRSRHSGSDSDNSHASRGRHRKKDGFLSKIQIPKLGGKKGYPHDISSTFRQWVHCIAYYRDFMRTHISCPLWCLP